MKIGISSLLFNINEALEICEKNTLINHIEIGIDNLEECEKLLNYKSKFENLNISLGIHLPMELNTCENINYIRNSWIQFINEMNNKLSVLNIKYYNLHLGYIMTNRLKKDRKKHLNNVIKFFDDKNLNKNIVITIENTYCEQGNFSNIGNNANDFEYIFKCIRNKNIFFCYDTGHFLINKDDYINKLNKNLKIVHLSDNDGIHDSHVGIGKGILTNDHIKLVMEKNIEYLILEMNHRDIEETLIILKSI